MTANDGTSNMFMWTCVLNMTLEFGFIIILGLSSYVIMSKVQITLSVTASEAIFLNMVL